MDIRVYDTLIVVTPADYIRLRKNYKYLVRFLPVRRVVFVGNEDVGKLVEEDHICESASYLNENEILDFDAVHDMLMEHMSDILNGRELPRRNTGWYYQQFIKMKYADICEDEYYMVWDGDTVPCKAFSMFNEESDIPYLDVKKEYHELYFDTMGKLVPGLHKFIGPSFISEHMLFRCDIMQDLNKTIETNDTIEGITFWEKIIHAIPPESIYNSAFSEFETYGNYVCLKNPSAYGVRRWHSFRLGGQFFDPDTISECDYEWLGRDFDAISFEKNMTVREDHKNLFDNKEYQSKLSAKQMLQIAQEEFKEGYIEEWD